MSTPRAFALSAVALCLAVPAAPAEPLSIINVSAPAINCVYDKSCHVMVHDTMAAIPMAGISGRAVVQSRTVTGVEGAAAAGKTGYAYRVNLTGAVGKRCVSALKLPFGPIAKLPYIPDGPYADIFVIVSGELGTIGLAAADKSGEVITITFSRPVCAGLGLGKGESSLFVGLTADEPPKPALAQVDLSNGASANVPVRAAVVQVEEPKPKAKPRSRSSGPRARHPHRP